MKSTPLQVVKKSFESREKLAATLAETVDKLNGDTTTEQVKSRLMGLSNKKLLRLYKVEQAVRERFGDREKLVAHIVSERKKGGLTADDAFLSKLAGFSKARLLDLTNQVHAPRAQKQTPEQRLAGKRGKKERARALSKLGKKA